MSTHVVCSAAVSMIASRLVFVFYLYVYQITCGISLRFQITPGFGYDSAFLDSALGIQL